MLNKKKLIKGLSRWEKSHWDVYVKKFSNSIDFVDFRRLYGVEESSCGRNCRQAKTVKLKKRLKRMKFTDGLKLLWRKFLFVERTRKASKNKWRIKMFYIQKIFPPLVVSFSHSSSSLLRSEPLNLIAYHRGEKEWLKRRMERRGAHLIYMTLKGVRHKVWKIFIRSFINV